MQMRLVIRIGFFLSLSILFAYLIEQYGFGIAHSAELTVLISLLVPGFLPMVMIGGQGGLSWILFACINCIFYELIYRMVTRKR